VSKVVLDPDNSRVEVVVAEGQLSLAIGRRGQNVRLASQLTGWQIDIMTESEDSERRQKDLAERTVLFTEALDVDEMMAQLLATEGFQTVEDVAYIDAEVLADIEGFNEELAEELQNRARDYLERQAAELDAKRVELGVDDAVIEVPGVTLAMAVALGQAGVKTLEDFAGLTPDDLRGWTEIKNGEKVKEPGILDSIGLTADQAETLIMEARIAIGWVEAPVVEDEAVLEGEGLEDESLEDGAFVDAEPEEGAR
jgi:N utilization substance protein A